MRIPIQLDALCYTWNESSQDGKTFQTMTAIYEATVVSLLRKDAVKLGKVCNGRELNNSTVAELSTIEIYGLMSEEIDLLEGLAFQGFYNGCIEFDKATRNHIQKYLKDRGDPLPQSHNHTLRSLSFLRSSNDGSEQDDQRSFHFIHLTFQEYFAACYFVKYWFKSSELPCIELRNNGTIARTPVLPRILLGQRKYAIRYNMVWRYVAGILCARSDNQGYQLTKFFEHLEAEPRDFLGPSHRNLLMQFLEELPSNTESPRSIRKCRAKIENSLFWWISFQGNVLRTSSLLSRGVAYPEYLLRAVFQQSHLNMKKHMLSGFQREGRWCLEQLAHHWVTEKHFNGQDVEEMAFRLIVRYDKESRRKTLDFIHDHVLNQAMVTNKSMLLTNSPMYAHAAAELSTGMDSPPKRCVESIVALLQHGDERWHAAASHLIHHFRLSLSPDIIHSLAIWLVHKDSWVETFKATTIDTFYGRFSGIRDNVKETLNYQSILSSKTQDYLIRQLDEKEISARCTAADVLRALSNLSPISLHSLGHRLKDGDLVARLNLLLCLEHYNKQPENVTRELLEQLIDQHEDICYTARSILTRVELSHETVLEIVKMSSYDGASRKFVERVLHYRSPLPSDITHEVWKTCGPCKYTWCILMSQRVLSPETL